MGGKDKVKENRVGARGARDLKRKKHQLFGFGSDKQIAQEISYVLR